MNEKLVIEAFKKIKEDINNLRKEIDVLREKLDNLNGNIEEPLSDESKDLIKEQDLFY